jgi:hypothetical protein
MLLGTPLMRAAMAASAVTIYLYTARPTQFFDSATRAPRPWAYTAQAGIKLSGEPVMVPWWGVVLGVFVAVDLFV